MSLGPAAVLGALLLAGCATQRLDADKTALAAGDAAGIADRAPPCADATPECRQAQEIRAEACRRLGRLDCALAAYRAAIGPESSRMLLLSLGHAAMQATATGQGDPAGNAAAQALAAAGLRRDDPADPEGCALAGSTQLTLALLAPPGAARCAALAGIPTPCRAVAPRDAQSRLLAHAIDTQTRSNGCP